MTDAPYPLGGGGFSMYCRCWATAVQSQVPLSYAVSNNHGWRFLLITAGSNQTFRWYPGDGSTFVDGGTRSGNQWRALVGTTNKSNDHRYYVDGTEYTSTSSISIGTTPDELAVGQYARYDSNKFTGYVAEVAAWDEQLTADESTALCDGVSPLLIRPASLLVYSQLNHGQASTDNEPDLISGGTLTQTNSPGVVAHPPGLIYPRRTQVFTVAGGSVPLSGSVSATVTTSGDLTKTVALDGSAAISATAAADVSATRGLESTSSATVTTSGDLTLTASLAAAPSITVSSSAALTIPGAFDAGVGEVWRSPHKGRQWRSPGKGRKWLSPDKGRIWNA